MTRNNWTREETIIAFNVYCKIPFKQSSKTHPTILKYAKMIGRSPSALNMKVGNIGRLDPELKGKGIVGLSHGSKIEEDVWNEFNGNWEKLAFQSEELIAKFQNKPISESEDFTNEEFPEGKESEAIIRRRVNQSFFRSTVLSSYNSKCCVTGLSTPELLVASHIKPWAIDKNNRVNPRNGLCLNALHDKAFDLGFITISTSYEVILSNSFEEYSEDKSVNLFFRNYNNHKIILPDRFLPTKDFLAYHNQYILRK